MSGCRKTDIKVLPYVRGFIIDTVICVGPEAQSV